jgi:hypothetical protein
MVAKVKDLHTTSSVSRNESTHNTEFAKGGKTKMFSKQAAEPQKEGHTADQTASDAAPGAKFAEGGKGKMFSFAGAVPARDGITSAR